jgi:NAD(P)-dependent dehydrogenase (short-subunit alcohol dehydrogenase family)
LKKPRYSHRVYDGINRATTVEELNSLASDFINSVGEFHRTKKDQEWPIDAYRSSKALLNGLARVQANEFRERGIFVASVCPGWVRTRMGGEAAPRSPDEGADTITWLATENLELADSGKFWQDRNVIKAAI